MIPFFFISHFSLEQSDRHNIVRTLLNRREIWNQNRRTGPELRKENMDMWKKDRNPHKNTDYNKLKYSLYFYKSKFLLSIMTSCT